MMGNILKGLTDFLKKGSSLSDIVQDTDNVTMNYEKLFNNRANKEDDSEDDSEDDKETNLRVKISSTPTGHTLSFVTNGEKIKHVVVKTYNAKLFDAKNNELLDFNVARDGFLSRGYNATTEYFANQCFEPSETQGNEDYYAHLNDPYPKPNDFGLKAFALTDKANKSTKIKALPFTTEQLTKLTGGSFYKEYGGHTRNPESADIADGVMLHIGGYYRRFSNPSNPGRVATSFGCFGFVPSSQVYGTKEDAEGMKDSPGANGTSNAEYAILWDKIGSAKKIRIGIEKRSNFDKTIEVIYKK